MKKYFVLAIVFMLAFSFTGCAERTPAEDAQSQIPPSEESKGQLLAEGENVTIDGVCEFHVDYVSMWEKPELFHEADAGKIYVDFCITYKNLADYTINGDKVMEGKLIYSGQYEYDGVDMAAEEDGSSLSPAHWIEMGPSDSGRLHYFFAVPKEVQDSGRMVELNMSIRENDYRMVVREGETGAVPASGNGSGSGKTSGEVVDGEVIITDNAEFYVEYSEFTEKVIPPSPGAAYNYYAAEDGKVLIDFCIAYTNRSAQNVRADKAVSAKLDQAETQATVTEQSGRSAFDYSNLVNIIPLCTEYVHYIFQVPQELENGSDQITISFQIDGNRYTYSVK